MQYNPDNRLNWEQMEQHKFFSTKESQKIPFNIIFDEDPSEGIRFKNNKIYVNTRKPEAY